MDGLADDATATAKLRSWGGSGTSAELTAIRAVRGDLHAVVRAEDSFDVLRAHLAGVTQRPMVHDGRLAWQLAVDRDRQLVARAVLAFFALAEQAPGRLRPCENRSCRLFLLDRSRAGTARWCSMAVCGNRMKARRHAHRTRGTDEGR